VLLGDDEERAAAAAAATARKSEFFVIVLAGASHRPLRAAVLFFSWFGIFHLRFGCERLKMDGPWGIFSISIFLVCCPFVFQTEMRVESVTGDRTRLPLGS
jgi:hypothetical protein